ncbi:MAG: hypothetical protein EPN48_11275 [Microbacteriaceae bacterium]|nr:MAG: hypothetical protein EPN48_11275 [Microbacteriaceae bacterium]
MKKKIAHTILTMVVAAVFATGAVTALGGCTTSGAGASSQTSDSTPHVLPTTKNPIVNTSTVPGLTVLQAVAENNVDPSTKKPIADRLQVTLKNSSTSTLDGFQIYYTMTDTKTHKSESYYQPLTGLTIAPGAVATVYFDNQHGANHYPENTFSIYRTSQNNVVFSIEVSAKGAAVATASAVKGKGTGEVVGG